MGGVGGENGDGVTGRKSVNCGLVGVGIALVISGKRVKGGVEPVVGLGDVLVEMVACGRSVLWGSMGRIEGVRTYGRELVPRGANHAQLANFPSPAQVEQSQADDADLLVRARHSTTDEAGGVLAGTDLSFTRQYLELRGTCPTHHQHIEGSHCWVLLGRERRVQSGARSERTRSTLVRATGNIIASATEGARQG